MTRAQFNSLVSSSLSLLSTPYISSASIPDIDVLGVGWAPFITTTTDRLDWEANGYPFVQLNETTGELVKEPILIPSAENNNFLEYLTIQFAVSRSEHSYLDPGFDLLSDVRYGTRSRAVAQARANGTVAITSPLSPIVASVNGSSTIAPDPVLLVAVPIYSLPRPPAPGADPQKTTYPQNTFFTSPVNLTLSKTNGFWGCVVTTFSPVSLLRRAFYEAGLSGVAGIGTDSTNTVHLVKVREATSGFMAWFKAAKISTTSANSDVGVWIFDDATGRAVAEFSGWNAGAVKVVDDVRSEWKRVQKIEIAGIAWTVVVAGNEGFGERRKTPWHITVPIAIVSIALTGYICRFLLFSSSSRKRRRASSDEPLPTASTPTPPPPNNSSPITPPVRSRNLYLS
ncbi:hypothetical protein HDU97_004770 [Phlyctochytrium planicorne]|nr:hypothetical protein HDU97_004770 [Phlyctochytrium planicorne]